jgi:UDP-glucose 4-epimerase
VKRVLITGVAGLLGSNFASYLLEAGYEVFGIDNLSGGFKDFIPKHEKMHFYECDLMSQANVNEVFKVSNPDVVFHFAAYAAEGLSPFIRSFNYSNNVVASANVINGCINYGAKLVFTSSMAVYGDQTPPFIESMQPKPIDPYGVAKYAVELDIRLAAEQFGMKYTIVRPHNIIGRNQNIWDRYRNVAGIFIHKALTKQPILVYGDGTQRRAFSDIKYYMRPLEQLIDGHDGQTFNLGADSHYAVGNLAEIVADCYHKNMGSRPEIKNVEKRHEAHEAFCNHDLAKSELGFKDETVLEELIEDMFFWAMEQPPREQKDMRYEVEKGIYSYWK